jgi:hypothetical protein
MTTDTKRVSLPIDGHVWSGAANVRRFLLHFLELQIPMALGALVCFLVLRLIPASPSLAAAYRPGTYLFAAGDLLFLTAPVVAWMNLRGHGWRHSRAMAGAMLAPVTAVVVLGQLAGYAYLPWLTTAGYPALSLGMLAYMLLRRDHFTGRVGQSTHAADPPAKTHAIDDEPSHRRVTWSW